MVQPWTKMVIEKCQVSFYAIKLPVISVGKPVKSFFTWDVTVKRGTLIIFFQISSIFQALMA